MVSASVMKMAATLGFVGLGIALAIAPSTRLLASQAPELADNAATAQPAANAGDDKALLDKGRELFSNWGCGSCHSLADAGGTGHVGPAFDGDANLSVDFITNRVTNGQGAMPSFGGQMTDDEIKTIATYIAKVAQK